MSEPTYTALTDNEQELQKLSILGAGIRATFHSVQDAVDQMQGWIAELEKERGMLRELLTLEQMRIAYPGPAEWVKENEMSEITLESIAKHCIDDNITGPQITYLLDAQEELTRLRNENVQIHTMIGCANCGNGVRPRNSIMGMCPACAEAEIMRLWGIEAAALQGDSREAAIKDWRVFAKYLRREAFPVWAQCSDAIADALGAK